MDKYVLNKKNQFEVVELILNEYFFLIYLNHEDLKSLKILLNCHLLYLNHNHLFVILLIFFE